MAADDETAADAPAGTKVFKSKTDDANRPPLARLIVDPCVKFGQEAYKFLKDCKRPKDQEYWQVATATLIGFTAVGLTGYLVKLIHIPITQILVGS